MPYRTFVDTRGAEWQVWDIVPRLSERRSIDDSDRRVEIRPIPFADRRRDDRRLTQARRTLLRGTYSHGWLCFDNGREKRRLSPIPGDWSTCDERTLDRYMHTAVPVPGAHRAFEPPDGEDFAQAG